MGIKASIIIPAYNIENYIAKCIKSCTNQTYKNIEIIVVNDGSTDKTLEVIKALSKEDERIVSINKENTGVAKTRETGYIKSTGDYIMFLDGDDTLREDTVELLVKMIEKDKSIDIVVYDFIEEFDDESKNIEFKSELKFDYLINEEYLKEALLTNVRINVVTKFIRRSFIKENNIKFPMNIRYAEDLAFTVALAASNPKVKYLEESLYYYYQRDGSVANLASEAMLDIKDALIFIKELLVKKDLYKKYEEEYNFCTYIHVLRCRYYNIFIDRSKYSKGLFKNWESFKINIIKNKYYKKYISTLTLRGRYATNIMSRNYTLGVLINKFFRKL